MLQLVSDIQVSVRAYGTRRVCTWLGTHDMAYGLALRWWRVLQQVSDVRVNVQAYGTWRVCARLVTHDMAYLDICVVWVSWSDEDVGFFEGV